MLTSLGTIVRRRACSFSPKCMSSDPVACGFGLTTGLAVFLLFKDHPRLDVFLGFNATVMCQSTGCSDLFPLLPRLDRVLQTDLT